MYELLEYKNMTIIKGAGRSRKSETSQPSRPDLNENWKGSPGSKPQSTSKPNITKSYKFNVIFSYQINFKRWCARYKELDEVYCLECH